MAKALSQTDITLLLARKLGQPVMTIEASPFEDDERIIDQLGFLNDAAMDNLKNDRLTHIVFDNEADAMKTFQDILASCDDHAGDPIDPFVTLAGIADKLFIYEFREAIERPDHSAKEPLV